MTELSSVVDELRALRPMTDEVAELGELLYATWYARPRHEVIVPPHFPVDLVQVLRAADATGRRWEQGWVADRVAPDGRVIARRGSSVRMADRCDYLAVRTPGLLPAPGDDLVMAGRRDRVDGDGAWWRTAGRAWRFTRAAPGLVRFYWNIDLPTLAALVGLITSALADEERPWMLKCAADPETHRRADATVLYVARDAVDTLAGPVESIAASVAAGLREGNPPLTLPIRQGLAVAVDPGDGVSFGQHRCQLIARAAGAGTLDDTGAVCTRIEASFDAAGIDPSRPYAGRDEAPLPWER